MLVSLNFIIITNILANTPIPNTPLSTGAHFAAAVGGDNPQQQVLELETQRYRIFQPQLESEYNSIQCSMLTRHMWSHAQSIPFEKKTGVFAWARTHLTIEVLHKGSVISQRLVAMTCADAL